MMVYECEGEITERSALADKKNPQRQHNKCTGNRGA
jgi:hypothetical protein